MASKVGIANVALNAIGATRIVAFDDSSVSANAINAIYDELRLTLLSAPWNFATTRIELARSATIPVTGFNYAYVLPSDWLWTISLHDNDASVSSIFFKEEQVGGQRVILADQENVFLRYIKDEEDPNLMSAEFRYAFSMALARDLAISLANSNTLHASLTQIAKRAYSRAQGSDALNSSPEQRPRGSWANSRVNFRRSIITGTN